MTLGGVKPGQTVLTLGTGGVSVFAVQFAKLLGARVVSTTSSEAKAAWLRELGAEHVVLYTEDERWGRAIRKVTGGVDHVVEVGGAGTLTQSLAATAPGGTISLIGVVAGGQQPLSIFPVFMNQLRVQGVFVGHRRGFEAMCAAIETHSLRPVVDQTFDFDQAADAMQFMQEARHRGKVVIRL